MVDTSKMSAEEIEQMVKRGKLYLKVCEYCGKNYYSGSSQGKYCCEVHRRKDAADKSRHIRVCEKCGKKFTITGGRSRARYCVDCQPEYHKKNEVCVICGTPLPKNRGKYCCDECYKKAVQSGCVKPKKEERVKYCIMCGAPLPKGREKYCSDKCCRDYKYGKLPLSMMSTAKKPLEHGYDLVSIAKAALEHHMTYGKYVEMLEKAHKHGV